MTNIRKALRTTAFALMGAALALPAVADPIDLTPKMKEEVLTAVEKLITTYAFVPEVNFDKWPEMIKQEQESLDAAKTEADFVGTVNRVLQQFGFSHIVLFGPTYADRRATNSMVGIGVRIQHEDDGLRVVFAFPEGPAGAAGVKPGDLIFEADGKPVRETTDLAGEEGSPVNIKVRRGAGVVDFQIVRKVFSTRIPESVEMLDSKTAIVTIPTFDTAYSRKNVEEIMGKAMKADSIVLDLRGNGGGAVMNLLHFSSYFLNEEQPMGKFVGRSDLDRYIKKYGSEDIDIVKVAEFSRLTVNPAAMGAKSDPFTGKVAVLVDGGTGSASEMLALALKEHCHSLLFGQPTAGAVLASQMKQIDHGFMLQFPLMDYVSFNGYRIEGHGLSPTYTTEPHGFGEPDRAVELAVKWIGGEIGAGEMHPALVELLAAA